MTQVVSRSSRVISIPVSIVLFANRCSNIFKVGIAVAVTLEWVKLPEGVRFRTVCRNGVPWFEPTGFLTQYGHIGLGSSRTVDTYAE